MSKELEVKVSDMNVFQKLLNITNELNAVAKNLNVNMGRGSYKATGEADVLAAVKPLEFKYGIYSYPFKRDIIVDKETTTNNGVVQQFIRNETIYRFVNVDKVDEFIDIITWGDGVDSGDKATGKAMTYADKYALLKAYKIITGDDPDQKASEEIKRGDKKETKTLIDKLQIEKITSSFDEERIKGMLNFYKIEKIEQLTQSQALKVISGIEREKNK